MFVFMGGKLGLSYSAEDLERDSPRMGCSERFLGPKGAGE